jgi:hypothetical protein
LFHEYVVTP